MKNGFSEQSAVIDQLEKELAVKNRALEVEAALEKVRARTMTMLHSDELMDAANLLFQQVHELGIPVWTCGFNIWAPEEKICTGWMSTNGAIQPSFRIPLTESPGFLHMYESRINGEEYFIEEIGGEALSDHYRFMFGLPDFRAIANEQLKDGFSLPTSQVHHVFNFKQGNLIFIAATPLPQYEETFKRFAKVFEQTYTRFLDLQKAEAQAREAKIEAALEKVRSSSLAIYRSDELKEVVTVLFEKLKELHIPVTSAGITIFMDGSKDLNIYVCGEHDNGLVISNYLLPYFDHPICNDFHAVKEKHLDFFVGNYSREEKNSFYEHVIEHTALKDLPENIKEMIFQSQEYSISMANVFHSMIAINNFEGKGLSENETDIIKRFARVFEQAYIRFLDLQKAEAQAREAEIQLALERVRARTMAMHKSEELAETSQVLFHQLIELGDIPDRISICIVDETNGMVDFWITDQIGAQINNSFRAQLNERTVIAKQYKGWKDQKKSLVVDLMGEELKEWMQFVREEMGIHVENEFIKNRRVHTSVFFSHGWILVTTHEPQSDETINILQRFAAVFNLTYRRFLDLQKAEAQAREAQIELALERVRAKTMAIQKPAEFVDVISVIGEQFAHLGFDNEWVNFGANGLDISKGIDIWELIYMPGHYQSVQRVFIPYIDHPVFNKLIEQFERYNKNGSNFFTILLDKKDLGKWLHHLYRETIYKEMPDEVKALGYSKTGSASSYITLKDTWLEIGKFGTNHFTDEQNEIFKRFANAFGQAYTRFVDLQKAEAQAREAQIELALERVRARTMAMHYSSELADTANILFQQIRELGFEIWSCGFGIWRPEVDLEEAWMSTGDLFPIIMVPFREDPTHLSIYEASQRGESIFEVEVKGEVLTRHYDWLMSQPSFKIVFSQIENSGIILPTVQYKYAAFFKQGYLHLITTKPQPDIHNINRRFAKVFEQTYTRFLDLQKAEAQAREAKIEAGLEKVRSKVMAMTVSKDLDETSLVFGEQLKKLGVNWQFSYFWLIDESKNENTFWITWPDYKTSITTYTLAEAEEYFNDCMVAWRGGVKVHDNFVPPAEVNNWLETFQRIADDAGGMAKEVMVPQTFPDGVFYYDAMMKFGSFGVCISKAATEEEKVIQSRFAIEFERAYMRFNDLKSAEAQAYEARIEASLERVRSKTMAMHNSKDVGETVAVLFDELLKLGVPTSRSGISIIHDNNQMEVWTAKFGTDSKTELVIGWMDATLHPLLQGIYESWKRKEDSFSYELQGDEVKTYFNAISRQPGYRLTTDSSVVPDHVYYNNFCFTDGLLFCFSKTQISEEVRKIFKRFAGMFGQTYRRYLDLVNAEAQTREAQIEAALERVRSRSMGMQKSEDLREIIQVIYEQFIQLGIKIDSAGFAMDYMESDDFNFWFADAYSTFPTKVHVPYFDHPQFIRFKEAKEKGLDFYTSNLTFEEKNKFFDHVFKDAPPIPQEIREVFYGAPGYISSHVVLKNIVLYILNYTDIPFSDEENATLMRFGKVFEQAYIRFNDLKQAEAQALEAVKRASVDRVRAEIASMRTTSDLERITPLIWNELSTLGVPFFRCGVFIMDEEKQEVQSYLSTPEGNAIAAFRQPYNTPGEISEMVACWHKNELYKQHWNEEKFIEFTQNLVDQHAITNGEKYLTENRPTDLYLHFVPFLQGMLYAGSTKPLTENELQLVQNLADAFSTAYARYEDFNRLEAAKKVVDKTLTDLKQTQAKLVQSEKMASLGELTAGIAHEIQNPLNFVNNFSELNKELLAELNREIEEGNFEEAKMIALDVTGNEEKISHHGRRAEAIVKGMLQHSRSGVSEKEATDINKITDEYLRLAYHGLRGKDKSFNAVLETGYDENLPKADVVPQDIGRVLLNIFNNAFYAVNERKKDSAKADNTEVASAYEPRVLVTTKKSGNEVVITVTDNGKGIPENIITKIFQPFFTTKPTGQGTGLGLSLAYDIITKGHGGELKVTSVPGEGTAFIITLPLTQ